MSRHAEVLDTAPELSLADLQDIKVPVELLEVLPVDFCREHRILPLRMDAESGTLSFLFVDKELGNVLDELCKKHGWHFLSAFRVSEEVFETVISQFEVGASKIQSTQGWGIALIESSNEIRESMKLLLESQKYSVYEFESEESFRKEIERLSERIQTDDDVLNLAENKELVPFQAVLVRKTNLNTPKTFCDYVWAHLNHLRVSVLEDRWLNEVFNRGLYQAQAESDDFGFYLRHGDYYHAALECLKKGNIFQAVELLEQVKEEDAHFIKAKILLGKAFLKKRNYNKATTHFQTAYDHWCEDPEGVVNETVLKLLYHLAYTFEKRGRLDDSLKLYERVAAEDPLFREVGRRLAKVKNKRKQAIKASEKKMGLPAFSKSTTKEQNRYERIEEIGKGGMGIVYRGRDRVLGREVALKVLNSHFKHDEKIVETFLREAKSLASLNHLNIVTIFDAGIEDGNYYISMEFIDGKTVRDLLKKKGYFKISTSLALSKQVLKALAYAHSKHVIHRDITTNNMMLTETKVVKLMDFGLARVVNQLHSEQSIIGGTPYFMSPEQVEGAPIDHRTDIYSFGVCLFEMITGQVPFPMENPGYHHLHSAPPDPKKLKPDMPQALRDLILRCLEKIPADRYQSVDEILHEIRYIEEQSVTNHNQKISRESKK